MAGPVRKGITRLREHGPAAFAYRALQYFGVHRPVWNTVTSRRPFGTNVFDRDWDLLVVLDACRADVLASLAPGTPFLEEVGRIRSVGSMTAEWMLNTFTGSRAGTFAETAVVSANIWSHRIFEERFHETGGHGYGMIHEGRPAWNPVGADAFAHHETVSPFANQARRLHPEGEHVPHVLTDRAIAVGRRADVERLVVHYTLPHLNHIGNALAWSPGETTRDELMAGDLAVTRDLEPGEKAWPPVRRREISTERLRENYTANLELALEYVGILLDNVDAERVVVTADHGEAFGERGVLGHPYAYPYAPVRTVPWAPTSATDERTYDPQYDELERPPTDRELDEHLRAMGYYPS